MKKNSIFIIYIPLLLFCFLNCRNSASKKVSLSHIEFIKKGKKLIKEIYDSAGKIEMRQFFNKDTIPDGAMIEYYSNGTVATWLWYAAKHKNPYCGIFYNEQAVFDTLKGKPFLGIENNKNNKPLVKLINPPQITVKLLYKDFYMGKVVNDIMYDPLPTDTISWVPLDEYGHKQDHVYKIYFYIVDTIKTSLLYQDSLEINEK